MDNSEAVGKSNGATSQVTLSGSRERRKFLKFSVLSE